MITSNDFKRGMTISHKGQIHQILEFQHVKPGKGHAFVRSKLKSLETGKIYEHTFRGGEKVEQIISMNKKMQFLYKEQDGFVLMDLETYEQISVPRTKMDGREKFLKEGTEVSALVAEENIIGVTISKTVELEVTRADPGVAGNTVQGATKSVTLETGAEIQVPIFIKQGEIIKVDTEDGAYLERVN